MPDPSAPASPARSGFLPLLGRVFGTFRFGYLPVLVTYFCYGASAITGVAMLYFQKDALRITPAEAAGIGFWLGLPWTMKMVVGVASDVYPILGSRRKAYLVLGALCSFVGYVLLATVITTKGPYLAVMVMVTAGYMIQDVVADALSVEVAQSDEEMAQIQTLGRMALLAGSISVGYLSGFLAGRLGSRPVFAIAAGLPVLVSVIALLAGRERRRAGVRGQHEHPLLTAFEIPDDGAVRIDRARQRQHGRRGQRHPESGRCRKRRRESENQHCETNANQRSCKRTHKPQPVTTPGRAR